MDLYCFGDSITYGDNDIERGGWVDRLKTACLSRRRDMNVYNLGIGGETTRGMRARLVAEIEARLDRSTRSVVTLAWGGNDAASIDPLASPSDRSFLVPETEYRDNLAWAIDRVRERSCEAWLLTVTPVVSDGVRSPSGRVRSNAFVARYNEVLRQLSQEKSAALIDVNAAFRGLELPSLFAADGVHPNARGHELISELVGRSLLSF